MPFWILALSPQPGLSGSPGLAATDAAPGPHPEPRAPPTSVEVKPGLVRPDAVVRAGASDLLLWLLGRRQAVTVEGDATIVRAWSAVKFG